MKTFSISTHSRLFSVPDYHKDFLFVTSGDHPYHEEPYRAESYALAYIKAGKVRLNVGASVTEVEAPALVTLAPDVIRYFTKICDQLKLDVILFKESFLMERFTDRFFLYKYPFFEINGPNILQLSGKSLDRINTIYELMHMTSLQGNYHTQELMRNYIFALIYEIDGCYKLQLGSQTSIGRENILFNQFRQLLTKNYIKEHKLDFYADKLNLLPKSLSTAVKRLTGKTAGKWIDETIVLEAKVLLQNRSLTVSQISGMLYFSDQSVFGKFFRANTGISPLSYRKSLSAAIA